MQGGIIKLQSPHDAGAEILHQHVSSRDQSANGFDALGRFQIEHQAVLADVKLAEGGRTIIPYRRTGPHRLALLGFNLDDLGAHIG
ncbi:hypothetical protein V1277_000964 [Bradyrhizobium sp. AZCC 1588]